jgi:beta-phosphoglucomutase-like phosphatase (HAD superfamily)
MPVRLFTAIALLATPALCMAGPMFKCTDAAGKVTFQDTACASGTDSQKLAIPNNATGTPTKSLDQTRRELNAIDKRLEAREAADEKQRAAAERANAKLMTECQHLQADAQRQQAKLAYAPGSMRASAQMSADAQKMRAHGCPGFTG